MSGKRGTKENLLKGNERGQGWTKGQSGNPFGRPKYVFKQLNEFMEESGYEKVKRRHFIEAFSAVSAMTMTELLKVRGEVDAKGVPKENGFPMLWRNAAQIMLGKDRLRALTEIHAMLFSKDGDDDGDYTPPVIEINVVSSGAPLYRNEDDIPDE